MSQVKWGLAKTEPGQYFTLRNHEGEFGQREVNHSTKTIYGKAGPYKGVNPASLWSSAANKEAARQNAWKQQQGPVAGRTRAKGGKKQRRSTVKNKRR